MTKLFLAPLLLTSALAHASHFISCVVEAKVESVSKVQRLDGSVVFSRNQSLVPSDHEQMLTLEILSVANQEGSMGSCSFRAQERVTLMQNAQDLGKYAEGQVLTLNYQNVGDALVSTISWHVAE